MELLTTLMASGRDAGRSAMRRAGEDVHVVFGCIRVVFFLVVQLVVFSCVWRLAPAPFGSKSNQTNSN